MWIASFTQFYLTIALQHTTTHTQSIVSNTCAFLYEILGDSALTSKASVLRESQISLRNSIFFKHLSF